MKDEEIRKRYQRDDESDLRGTNVEAINKFIEMLHIHEKSEDLRIRNIAENFEYIDKIAPNFEIFQNQNSSFMRTFNLYQITKNTNMTVATHEFGHALLYIMNQTIVPENYQEVIENAKKHAILPENKEYFKEYIQYICGKTDKSNERTFAEMGPVSDIIGSIFQQPGLRIGSKDNICIFPYGHSREYYFDEENGIPNLERIFDEDFANYYALKVNGCEKEIETIKKLFGDEFINTLEVELDKISERLVKVKENEEYEKSDNLMEQIKGIIVSSRQSEIQSINSLEKINEKESKGERDE